MSEITRLLQKPKTEQGKDFSDREIGSEREFTFIFCQLTDLKIKSPLTLRVLPSPPTLSQVKNKKGAKRADQAGKAPRSRSEKDALPGAGSRSSGPVPGARAFAFSALQPVTGILSIGQAKGSLSKLQGSPARWKCRPKLGNRRTKWVPAKSGASGVQSAA